MKTRTRSIAFVIGTTAISISLFGSGCATARLRVCEVHGVPMTKETVISGGFAGRSSNYVAPQNKFPHNGALQGGGCLVFVTKKMYVCPACKEAAEAWWRHRGRGVDKAE